MRLLFLLLLALGIALGLGAWSADWALRASADYGTAVIEPWVANPLAGAVDADPYAKARLARLGNLTLGTGEGVVFRARADAADEPLRRECNYVVSGQTPPARAWTLAAYTPEGRLIQPPEGQPGWLVSTGLLRAEDNSASIAVGPVAMPGNWLSTTGEGPFILALTLYDTPASSSGGLGEFDMPGLVRSGCYDG